MPGTSRRHFDDIHWKALLDALEEVRRACVQAGRKAPIRGDIYLSVEKVIGAIDNVALVLTGRRDHF